MARQKPPVAVELLKTVKIDGVYRLPGDIVEIAPSLLEELRTLEAARPFEPSDLDEVADPGSPSKTADPAPAPENGDPVPTPASSGEGQS